MERPRNRPLLVALLAGANLLALAVAAPGALANTLTPRAPHSPNAGDIDDAYKIVAILAVLLVIAVNVAVIAAVVRYRAARGRTPARIRGTPRAQARAGGGALVVALIAFVLGVVFTERARDVGGDPLEIRVAGQQSLWRYTYPDGTFAYYELVVPVNRTVELDIDSTDVVHRWWIPSLGGKSDAVPGRINHASFRADEEGLYEGQSAAFSGPSYPAMRAAVRVVSEPDFESWLARQKQDIKTAEAAAERGLAEAASSGSEAEQ